MINTRLSPRPGVVVTGIGLRTGLGPDVERSWEGLRSGRSAIRALDASGCHFGAPAGLSGTALIDDLADQAIRDAGLVDHRGNLDGDRDRIGVAIGLSKGDLPALAALHEASLRKLMPAGDWSLTWPDAATRRVCSTWRLRGPSLGPIAACATGVVAVLRGAELIRNGTCDLVLAGAADASLEPLVLGAFRRMRVLARVDGDPAQAVRPWDRGRSGFLVGEGGAVLVLERETHARSRGALPYAEVAGGALGSDAAHETNLDPDPRRLAALIQDALRRAEMSPRRCRRGPRPRHGDRRQRPS